MRCVSRRHLTHRFIVVLDTALPHLTANGNSNTQHFRAHVVHFWIILIILKKELLEGQLVRGFVFTLCVCVCVCVCVYVYVCVYTGCHRRNGPNFGNVFLMLNYTDITQNTYIQSWTVTEIMAREKCGHLAFPRTVLLQLCSAFILREQCSTHFCECTSSAQRDKIAFHYCRYVQCLVTLRTTVTLVRVFL